MPLVFCDKCEYPIIDGVCKNCADEAERERQSEEEDKRRQIIDLGGLKAYHEFTATSYDRKDLLLACDGFPERNLFLWGAAGSGKTHLSVALVRNWHGLVVKPQQIFRELRGFKKTDEEEKILKKYIHQSPLVIDDIGTEKSTEFSYSAIYEILDGRDMNYKKGLILTSNLNLDMLAQKFGDDRLVSRIAGLCGINGIIQVTGKDRRLTSKV